MNKRARRAEQPLGLLPRRSNGVAKPAGRAQRWTIALVQFAPEKGDVDANLSRIREAFADMAGGKQPFPDVVVFPESSLSGYFLEGGVRDVALSAKEAAARLNEAAAEACGKGHATFDVIAGFYEDDDGKLYNSALYATLGRAPAIRHVHRKLFLATYGVFDEERFVSRGRSIDVFDTPAGKAAMLICEDACHSLATTVAVLRGARIIYIPSASPGRGLADGEPANVRMWRDIIRVAAAEHGVFIAYAGLLGFEGGKGLTGASRLVGPFGDLHAEAPFDKPAILTVDVDMEDVRAARAALPMLGDLEANLAELRDMLDEEIARRPKRKRSARR